MASRLVGRGWGGGRAEPIGKPISPLSVSQVMPPAIMALTVRPVVLKSSRVTGAVGWKTAQRAGGPAMQPSVHGVVSNPVPRVLQVEMLPLLQVCAPGAQIIVMSAPAKSTMGWAMSTSVDIAMSSTNGVAMSPPPLVVPFTLNKQPAQTNTPKAKAKGFTPSFYPNPARPGGRVGRR